MPKICRFSYELALLLALGVVVLVPFHSKATQHYNIDGIAGRDSVSFSLSRPPVSLAQGDSFPVYRFNPQWTSPIGYITVALLNNKNVIATFDPAQFSWPMGRQGRVTEVKGSRIKISMGKNQGLKKGDLLILFKDRARVGKLRLREVFPEDSWADFKGLRRGMDLAGMTVSEFKFATQTVTFKSPLLAGLEHILFLLLFLSHCYFFIFRGNSVLTLLGNFLRAHAQKIQGGFMNGIAHILLGIPFVWFIANVTIRSFVYVAHALQVFLSHSFHGAIPILSLGAWQKQGIATAYVLLGLIYVGFLVSTRTSPILLFWRWVAYKPREKRGLGVFLNDWVIWLLHLVIFYAFGRTLWVFLTGNLKAIFEILQPRVPFAWNQLNIFSSGLPLQSLAIDQLFLLARYFLWSVTILGCLFGYLYSVLGYLWGKRIRNLDFTLTGWVVNALCYGPLLGAVLWQMCPPLVGADPVADQGPLRYYVYIAEFLLNLLYTLSIWNLGTMFGVMTDKGVRTSGFYSVVRHPSYTLETLMFVMLSLRGLSTLAQWLAAGMFILIYYIRSEREDQFMTASNPGYQSYQKNTPYKFIPGVY